MKLHVHGNIPALTSNVVEDANAYSEAREKWVGPKHFRLICYAAAQTVRLRLTESILSSAWSRVSKIPIISKVLAEPHAGPHDIGMEPYPYEHDARGKRPTSALNQVSRSLS
jgi:hypothetical protein